MTAEYKVRAQVSDDDRGLVHLTIRVEKHLFLDHKTIKTLVNVGDGIEEVRDMIEMSSSVLKALGPEAPNNALLGLESSWSTISETGAEAVLEKYYQQETSFSASLQGGARDGRLLVTAGAASMSVPLSKDQAVKDQEQLQKLKDYCDANPPQKEGDIERAKDAIVGVGTTTGAVYKMGVACLEGAVAGGGQATKSALGCIVGVIAALASFIGLVSDAEKQQKKESEMRDRERVCGPTAGEPSPAMMDRMSRTC